MVTLVMALVLMAGWVRSLQTFDNVLLVVGKVAFDIESKDGSVEFMLHRIFGDRIRGIHHFQQSRWRTSKLPIAQIPFNQKGISLFSAPDRTWRYQKITKLGGVAFASGGTVVSGRSTIDHLYTYLIDSNNSKMKNRVETLLIACSYAHLVIPLTLLSAYLLLSKPRKSIQIKIDEPIPVEGQ
jgi:hypothetical protein